MVVCSSILPNQPKYPVPLAVELMFVNIISCSSNFIQTKVMEDPDNCDTVIDPWDNKISPHVHDLQMAMADFMSSKEREEYNLECTRLTKKVEIQINRGHVNTLEYEVRISVLVIKWGCRTLWFGQNVYFLMLAEL